ncbi:30S ribosomal protein S10 [Candidatus Jorgensenbacteria bacterium GWA1_54_12]|uniref:Small ribosomal subunit protein uS10 n=1 Tax=Candidatus Jorgensenbacteria bacterium GWA1_54_12 TaxID=1798468 RepID=A0A1F6BL85_9BACT|nr:MAG: 30S ribosomal protein S10 [Candidatus Jorgensenbacteria bacterium GWA1_54_12]
MSASKQVESVLRLRVKSYDARLIDSAVRQIVEAIERYGGSVVGPIPLPTAVRRYTVNRSPFVHKKSREQFEMKVHKRLVEVPKPDQKIVEALGSLNLPAGIDVEVKMV